MSHYKMKGLLILMIVSVVYTCSTDPELCVCYRRKTLAFCVDKDLSQPPIFPTKILTHLKHLSLIGNRIPYITQEYIKQLTSIIAIDLRAQRLVVNCTLLSTLQNIVKSDCPRILVNDARPNGSTQEPDITIIHTEPPVIRTKHRNLALSLGIVCILAVIIISSLAKGYTVFSKNGRAVMV